MGITSRPRPGRKPTHDSHGNITIDDKKISKNGIATNNNTTIPITTTANSNATVGNGNHNTPINASTSNGITKRKQNVKGFNIGGKNCIKFKYRLIESD